MSHFITTTINVISSQYNNDGSDFCVLGHCEVQEQGGIGGEAFAVIIVSPGYLKNALLDGRCELGRGYLIMNDYDIKLAIKTLQTLIDHAGASSWEKLSAYVEKYFDWV